jgi:hypothetical protein
MRSCHLFSVKLILILCIILLLSIFGDSVPKISESIVENYGLQEQLISYRNLTEIENLSLFENSEEEEQNQYLSSFNSFPGIINNHYNSIVSPIMKKHIKNVILFESDNSPPLRKRS